MCDAVTGLLCCLCGSSNRVCLCTADLLCCCYSAKYTDHKFGPGKANIKDETEKYEWKRMHEINPNAKFISNGAVPSDIQQGYCTTRNIC